MASTKKTKNLALNSWVDSDKPRRVDFVEDNEIIDEVLGNHLLDTTLHFTNEDREKFSSMVYKDVYGGNDETTRTFTLPFAPSFVIVYNRTYHFTHYDPELGYNMLNGAIFSTEETGLYAGSINGNVLTIHQSTEPQGGMFCNLNKRFHQYGIIAVR